MPVEIPLIATHLFLQRNRIAQLPAFDAAKSGISKLDLSLNRLGSVPNHNSGVPALSRIPTLFQLDLSDNQLSSCEWDVPFNQLHTLNLARNRIADVTARCLVGECYPATGKFNWLAKLMGET